MHLSQKQHGRICTLQPLKDPGGPLTTKNKHYLNPLCQFQYLGKFSQCSPRAQFYSPGNATICRVIEGLGKVLHGFSPTWMKSDKFGFGEKSTKCNINSNFKNRKRGRR